MADCINNIKQSEMPSWKEGEIITGGDLCRSSDMLRQAADTEEAINAITGRYEQLKAQCLKICGKSECDNKGSRCIQCAKPVLDFIICGESEVVARNYTLHWTEATPYKCWVVYVAGPDVAGAMKELDRNFKLDDEDVASGCPKMSEYLMPEIEDPTPSGRDAGRFFWHTKLNNIVIYFPSMNPKLSTLGHELYHAVRRISRKKRLENDHDEPEAYLFEHLFEYFAGKIEEDCRAVAGAEQNRGGRK